VFEAGSDFARVLGDGATGSSLMRSVISSRRTLRASFGVPVGVGLAVVGSRLVDRMLPLHRQSA
jgi:hypothetical protein